MKYRINKMNKKKIIIIVVIVIIIIITIIVLLYNLNRNGIPKKEKKEIKYYRCMEKELGVITKEIFEDNNINQNNKDWNLYIPCGYNDVERELQSIDINNNKDEKYIFGINGCDRIVSKNEIWKQLRDCYGRSKASTMMPETWILSDNMEMQDFKKKYNGDTYILKKNIQRKEGLLLTDNLDIIENAKDEEYRVVQKYIKSLFLVGRRKVNLRIYYLIIIRNGTISFYISNLGKCIYTNKDYNSDNTDFESNITSFNLDIHIYKTHPLTFEDLKRYINQKYPNGGNILFERIRILMVDVSNCIHKSLYQSKNLSGTSFQLFGIDVIFDENLYPYILELNKGPDMQSKDQNDHIIKTKVQYDMYSKVGIISNNNNDNNVFELIVSEKK